MDKQSRVFVSYVFDHFKDVVEQCEKLFGQARDKGVTSLAFQHLAKGEAYAKAPLENSLEFVTSSRYVVILLGEEGLGTEARDGKTYVELEVEAAIEDENVAIFAYCFGDKFLNPELLNQNVKRLVDALSQVTTLSVVLPKDRYSQPQKIFLDVVSDFNRTLGVEDTAQELILDQSLLNVSGFNLRTMEKVPEIYRKDFESIYFGESGADDSASTLQANILHRKQLVCESLMVGIHDDAMINLDRILDENPTDLFACFWKCRLTAFHSQDEKALNLATILGQKTLAVTEPRGLDILNTLTQGAIALAHLKLGKFKEADEILQRINSGQRLYEIDYISTLSDLYQSRDDSAVSRQRIEAATEKMLDVFKKNTAYFLLLRGKLSQFENGYAEVEAGIVKGLNKTYNGFFQSFSSLKEWAEKELGLKVKQVSEPDPAGKLLEERMNASDLAYAQFRLIRKSLKHVFEKLGEQFDHYRELEASNYKVQATHHLKELAREKLADHLTQYDDLVEEKSRTQAVLTAKNAKFSFAHMTKIISSVLVFGLVIVAGAGIQHANELMLTAGGGGAVFFLLLAVLMNNREKSLKAVLDGINQDFEALDDRIRQQSLKIKRYCTSPVISIDVDEKVEIVSSSMAEIRNWLKNGADEDYFEKPALLDNTSCLDEIKESQRQLTSLALRIEDFETYTLSAHKQQYCYALLNREKLTSKLVDAVEELSLAEMFEVAPGTDNGLRRCLLKGGNRIDAWVSPKVTREFVLLDFLLELETDNPIGAMLSSVVPDSEAGFVMVRELHVATDDYINEGDRIFSIELDGEVRTLQSGHSGIITEIHIEEGKAAISGTSACSLMLVPEAGVISNTQQNSAPSINYAAKAPKLQSRVSANGIVICCPVLPDSIDDATVASLHCVQGQSVSADQNLADVETDKVVLEVVAPHSGVITQVLVEEGETILAEQPIMVLETNH